MSIQQKIPGCSLNGMRFVVSRCIHLRVFVAKHTLKLCNARHGMPVNSHDIDHAVSLQTYLYISSFCHAVLALFLQPMAGQLSILQSPNRSIRTHTHNHTETGKEKNRNSYTVAVPSIDGEKWMALQFYFYIRGIRRSGRLLHHQCFATNEREQTYIPEYKNNQAVYRIIRTITENIKLIIEYFQK